MKQQTIGAMRWLSLIALAATLLPVQAGAADYPARQVRIVVGAVTGGGVDVTARVVASRLSELLGQQFIVDNRPGAGGNIGSDWFTALPASVPLDISLQNFSIQWRESVVLANYTMLDNNTPNANPFD